MKSFKRQKGQAIVEFALILPIACFMLLAMIYCGFWAADYVKLNSAASVAAREAALSTDGKTITQATKNKIKGLDLFMDWYDIAEPSAEVHNDAGTPYTEATVTAKLKSNFKSISFKALLNEILPEEYSVSQSMYLGEYTNGTP